MDLPDDIVSAYKRKEFDLIDKKNLMVFTGPLLERSKPDMKILKTWCRHFELVGTPYVVYRYMTIFAGRKSNPALGIIKERRVCD